jgi:pectin methylesterase-like acyl-CoA thioesterase
MRKITAILSVLAAAILAGRVAVPATVAGASGPPSALWVSPTGTLQAGPGTNCSLLGYRTVQSAINAGESGVTIHVCAGTYTQQLKIKKSLSLVGRGSPSIVLSATPATPANGTSSCDLASNTAVGDHLQSEIDICGHISVSISGLTVEPKWATSTCSDDLYGVLVAGGATLTAQNVAVNGGGAYPINGCQGGIGIEVGMSWTTPVSVGTATLKGVSVEDY